MSSYAIQDFAPTTRVAEADPVEAPSFYATLRRRRSEAMPEQILAPTGVEATPCSSDEIKFGVSLAWTPSASPGVTGYEIYRTDAFGLYTRIGSVSAADDNVYVDADFPSKRRHIAKRSYTYVVRAAIGRWLSRDSNATKIDGADIGSRRRRDRLAAVAVSEDAQISADAHVPVGARAAVLVEDALRDPDLVWMASKSRLLSDVAVNIVNNMALGVMPMPVGAAAGPEQDRVQA